MIRVWTAFATTYNPDPQTYARAMRRSARLGLLSGMGLREMSRDLVYDGYESIGRLVSNSVKTRPVSRHFDIYRPELADDVSSKSHRQRGLYDSSPSKVLHSLVLLVSRSRRIPPCSTMCTNDEPTLWREHGSPDTSWSSHSPHHAPTVTLQSLHA